MAYRQTSDDLSPSSDIIKTGGPLRSDMARTPIWGTRVFVALALLTMILAATVGMITPSLVPSTTTGGHAGSADPGSAAAGPLAQSISATPALKAAVENQIDEAYASPLPWEKSAAATLAPTLSNDTPNQILAQAGLGSLVPALDTAYAYDLLNSSLAASSGSSGLRADESCFLSVCGNWGPWQGYLTAFGTNCLDTGGAFFAGAATATVIGTSANLAGVVVTKATPVGLFASCMIGGAVGIILYQMGLNQASAAVNYGGLWDEFAGAEWEAYNSAINQTEAMFGSIASLLLYAQVAFARAADNAALLQLNRTSFSPALDLLNSGLAYSLGSITSDYAYSLGQDFLNLPLWLNALSAQGGYYAGYGYLQIDQSPSEAFKPTTQMYANYSGSSQNVGNATVGGLTVSLSSTPSVVLYGSAPGVTADVVCPHACSIHLAQTPRVNGAYTQSWWNVSAATLSHSDAVLVTVGVQAGLYNISSNISGVTATIPFASSLPTVDTPSLGSYGWADNYVLGTGSTTEAGESSGSCVYSPLAVPTLTLGSNNVGLPSADSVIGLNFESENGACASPSAVTPVSNYQTASASTSYSGNVSHLVSIPSFNAWTTLSSIVGEVELNATLSGQTYWTFLRGLGYDSATSIPANCLIPAPYADMPAQTNLGNLTLNASIGFYESWLVSLGAFYGASPAFSVCGSGREVAWNYLTDFYGYDPYVNATGGIYLNNGTAPINTTGKHLASESLSEPSTWAVPVITNAEASGAGYVATATQAATSASTITTSGTEVKVGETVIVDTLIIVTSGSPTISTVTDSAGNTYEPLAQSIASGDGEMDVWVANSTTVAGSDDEITVTTSGSCDLLVQAAVFTGDGVVGTAGVSALVDHSTATLLKMTHSEPAGSASWVIFNGLTATNATKPTGGTAAASQSGSSATTIGWYTGAESGSTVAVGSGSGYSGAFVVTVASQEPSNATLFLVPLLHSVNIPVGSTWPVPQSNPIWAFYAVKNASQSNGNATGAGGGWSLVQLLQLAGNGTTNGTGSKFSGAPGDSIFVASCYVNGTNEPDACPVIVTNFTIYTVQQTCGLSCNVVNPGGGGGLGGACGQTVAIWAQIVGFWAGLTGTSGLGCLIAEGLALITLLVVIVVVAAVIVWAVRRE
jgi:hypothetical protein